ncbi:MAG TPA: alpha/beta hydrolase [Chloroflexota bacterium]
MMGAEKRLKMSHGETCYFEGGAGYPAVMLHGAGFTSGGYSWLNVMQTMGEQYHCYAMDCLNFGPGDVFDEEFSFAYMVDHVREFMDLLDLDRAHVIGRSMGGWIATLFAYESPERVNKLVLQAPGGAATRPLQNMVNFKVPEDERIRQAVESSLKDVDMDPEPIVQEYLGKAHDPAQVDGFAKVMKHMTAPLTRQRYNTVRRLPFIKAPTLVCWGTADQTNDFSLAAVVHGGIKGSKLAVFEGAGHGICDERPAEFSKEVLAFLNE